MTVTISASAGCVRSALAAVRRAAGFKLADSREVLRSGGEDGLYRSHLQNGAIVEVTVIPRSFAQAFVQPT